MIRNIRTKLTNAVEKNSPGLCCIGGGLLIFFGSLFLAHKAYKKGREINDDHEKRMEPLDNTLIDEVTGEEVPAVQNRGSFIIHNYLITSGMFIKEFAIPFGMVVSGLVLMSKGALKYKGRYLSAASALALRSAEFDALCHRVIDKYGQDGYDLINGVETEEYEETYVSEDGTEVTVTKTRRVLSSGGGFKGHPYREGYLTFILKPGCFGYDPSPFSEYENIKSREARADNEVHLHERLCVNEVLKWFDMPECEDLKNTGWNVKDPNFTGVSFGIKLPYAENVALLNGDSTYKNVFILTFNCTGDIHAYGYEY